MGGCHSQEAQRLELSHFQLLQRVGSGGFGVVYSAIAVHESASSLLQQTWQPLSLAHCLPNSLLSPQPISPRKHKHHHDHENTNNTVMLASATISAASSLPSSQLASSALASAAASPSLTLSSIVPSTPSALTTSRLAAASSAASSPFSNNRASTTKLPYSNHQTATDIHQYNYYNNNTPSPYNSTKSTPNGNDASLTCRAATATVRTPTATANCTITITDNSTNTNTGIYCLKRCSKSRIVASTGLYRAAWQDRLIGTSPSLGHSHPFILPVLATLQTPLELILVTPYMQGGDLQHHMRSRQPSRRLMEDEAKFFAAEILLALQALHSQGFVYRDLKPANVLLDGDGHIRLCDFGISTSVLKSGDDGEIARDDEQNVPAVSRSSHHAHHQSNNNCYSEPSNFCVIGRVGTESYRAPEMMATISRSHHHHSNQGERVPYGVEVDYWAFAITLYELLHGHLPLPSNIEWRKQERMRRLQAHQHNLMLKQRRHQQRLLAMQQQQQQQQEMKNECENESMVSGLGSSDEEEEEEDKDCLKVADDIMGRRELYEHGTCYISPHLSESARSLLLSLLHPHRSQRLGCMDFVPLRHNRLLHTNQQACAAFMNGWEQVKQHEFFADMDWNLISQRRAIPPYLPPSASLSSPAASPSPSPSPSPAPLLLSPLRGPSRSHSHSNVSRPDRPSSMCDAEYLSQLAPIAEHEQIKFRGFDYNVLFHRPSSSSSSCSSTASASSSSSCSSSSPLSSPNPNPLHPRRSFARYSNSNSNSNTKLPPSAMSVVSGIATTTTSSGGGGSGGVVVLLSSSSKQLLSKVPSANFASHPSKTIPSLQFAHDVHHKKNNNDGGWPEKVENSSSMMQVNGTAISNSFISSPHPIINENCTNFHNNNNYETAKCPPTSRRSLFGMTSPASVSLTSLQITSTSSAAAATPAASTSSSSSESSSSS